MSYHTAKCVARVFIANGVEALSWLENLLEFKLESN